MKMNSLINLIRNFPEEEISIKPRPYFNHSVEFKRKITAKERAKILEKVGLNVFFFPSEFISGCDLLSDSGTTTLTNKQWASLHLGDEAYGSNKGYFLLFEKVREVFGEKFFSESSKIGKKPNAFIFHQGRAAEDALFTQIGKLGKGLIIPSNGHFDTTKANIEANNMKAVDLFSPEIKKENSKEKFKGDMDIEKFKKLLKEKKEKIPLVYLTITNNTAAGQPVSMRNIREVSELSHSYNIPLFLDACRFAENAYFIKKNEKGYGKKSIKEVVKEIFSYVDGFTISFKKDGLVNMGGGLFLKEDGLFMKKYPKISDNLMNEQILKEGHPTYGGLSGRDIMALVEGLEQVTKEEYLDYRISQVKEFGERMNQEKLPVLMPPGGHAIYLDMNKFFSDTSLKGEDFGGISFTAILLSAYGHRACELGYFAFGYYDKKTGREIFPEVNFVRFAVPRLRYESQDLESVVEATKRIYDEREKIPGVEVVYGRDLKLRHFKARFRFKKM